MDPLEKARNVIHFEFREPGWLHDRFDRRFADAVHTLRSILENQGKNRRRCREIRRKIDTTLAPDVNTTLDIRMSWNANC